MVEPYPEGLNTVAPATYTPPPRATPLGSPFFDSVWSKLHGKPYVTVSAKGIANGLSDIPNDGADFGPDTPNTQTSGIQEAINYATSFSSYKAIKMGSGIFNVSETINLPGWIDLSGVGMFETAISANNPDLTIFKNKQNEGFQTIHDFSFTGTAYRGIDMSNLTSSNNGDNVYIHNIRFNAQYNDCQIDMDNNGQSILENIWNTVSGTTSTYSLRWNVNGEDIKIYNFIDGSANGMLLSSQDIKMIGCSVNRITLNLPFQTIRNFSFSDGALNGYSTSNPTFKILANSGTIVSIQTFRISNTLWQQGGISALFDLSEMLGSLYFYYAEFDNVIFNDGDYSSTVAWTTALPSGSGIGFYGLIPYKFSMRNLANNTWGTFSSSGDTYTKPPFTQLSSYSNSLLIPVLVYGTPSVPASGTAVTNTNQYPVKVYINGGALTEIQITINGTAYTVYSNSTASAVYESFTLPVGASITLTYTTAPTWTWLPE